jgi:hypothetical protein
LKRSESLQIPFKIIEIGQSTKGNSVVPESWLGRIFNNGKEYHNEMDKLDWRYGKPPVHFCCIYSMTIKDISKWSRNIRTNNKNIILGISIIPIVNDGSYQLISRVTTFYDNDDITVWKMKHYKLDCMISNIGNGQYIIIGTILSLISKEPSYIKSNNVGVLVSRLQKCIRRGRHCPLLLSNTIKDLGSAPSYNLPEQQYTRTSGSRQLTWRLYISIIEDAIPYLDDDRYFNMLDIVCLSILCHSDPNIQLCKPVIDKLMYTALLVQYNDKVNSNWNWRSGTINNNIDLLDFEYDNIKDSIKLSLLIMPMMFNDRRMLSKGLDLCNRMTFNKLEVIPLQDMLDNSIPNIELETRLISY